MPVTSNGRKPALIFIFITLLIDVTGLGIIIPVMPGLIRELIGGTLSEASRYNGWLLFSFSIMQFVCAPLLGALSDRYGRRPVLLLSLLGFALDYVLLSLAPTIGWLFAGRLIAGVMGASFTTATAYIADISHDENRVQNFGMIGAAFGLGFIIGPAMGGLLGELGTRVPFMVAAALAFLNFLYGYFILPESLPAEHRRKFEWKRANPIGALMHLKKNTLIIRLAGALFFIYLAGHATQSTWAFYTMEKFKWSEGWVGFSLGVVGLLVGIVQGGLIRYINPILGSARSVTLGLFLYAIGFAGFAFAYSGWMMYVALLPYCLGGIAGPALQGILSGQVPKNEQGELQGAITSLMSLTAIFGPPMMSNLFAHFTSPKHPVYFPGAPFLLGCFLTLISFLLASRAVKIYQKS
jgi:MFS transporter, DHA1 family, tetracycline resistance protein